MIYSLLGLSLEAAIESLGDRQFSVVETEPPFTPRHYTPIWGTQRVLRVRELPDNCIEVLVGYELLREEKNELANNKLSTDANGEPPQAATLTTSI
jgi:hypothetical protein